MQGVATTVKHYAGNEAEFERFTISADVDERARRADRTVVRSSRLVAAGESELAAAGVRTCAAAPSAQ